MEKIFGKNVTEQEKSGLAQWLKLRRRLGKEIEEEFEKTPEISEMIREANKLIFEELEKLNIPPQNPIAEDKVHVLPHRAYEALDPTAKAHSDNFSRHVYVDLEEGFRYSRVPRVAAFATILHELIHSYSFATYYYDKSSNKLYPYRSGYNTTSPFQGVHYHFQSFNEAVIETMTENLLRAHTEEISQRLEFDDGELESHHHTYETQRVVIQEIVNKLARFRGEDEKITWHTIE